MKKFYFLSLLGSMMIFNSCNRTEDNELITEPTEKKLLLSKATTIYYDNPSNPYSSVATFEYNNQGEIIKMLSEGRTAIFEYNHEKPVKITYYNPDQTLDYYTVFSYSGDQLVNTRAIYDNPKFGRSSTYTYNSNGQLTSSTLCQSENCSNQITSSYTYNGGNISVETSNFGSSSKREFSYDNRLNPFTHTNKYLRIMMGGAYALSQNNYITDKTSYKNSDGTWVQNQNTTYTIQYNDDYFPVQVIGKEANGNNTVQYNYEYTTLYIN